VELSDYLTGTLPPRKLINYIKALPPDSAYAKARYGEVALWDLHLHRLTDILEAVLISNWQRTGKRGGFPQMIPRPGQDVRSDQPAAHTVTPGDVLPGGEKVLGPAELNDLFDRRERALEG
jgi:hypothetical protein